MAFALAAALTACSSERRPVGAELPLTAPTGADDPRVEQYQGNAYQVSQGSRYYLWYGCGGCHAASGSRTAPDLTSGHGRRGTDFNAIYASIAFGHLAGPAAYEVRIPAEQLWQMTAYVYELPSLDPQKRRRQDADTFAEPQDQSGPRAW